MFLTNLSKREKMLFYLTLAVISLSLIYNFVLKPLGERWARLNQQILSKEIELKRNLRYLGQEDKIKSIYPKYARYVQTSGSDEELMSSFLNVVEQQARVSEIHIANIRPQPVKDLVSHKKYILQMDCVAPMEKYIEFIYNLQNSAQLIRVEKLQLNSQGKDNPLLKAQMLISKVQIIPFNKSFLNSPEQ